MAESRGKRLGLFLLSLSGAFQLGRELTRKSLVVLTYHRVLAGGPNEKRIRPSNTVFTSEFEEQIKYLTSRYHVATGEEVRLFLTGKQSLPVNSAFITFDDGYENNFREAVPILLRHGATATFFLTTELIGQSGATLWFDKLDFFFSSKRPVLVFQCLENFGLPATVADETGVRKWIKQLSRQKREAAFQALEHQIETDRCGDNRALDNLMTWDQVRQMAKAGMTIGSHTASHQILASATPEEVEQELVISRLKIERETGESCWCFAYPNGETGDFRASDKVALQAAGYLCAFTQIPGFITVTSDQFALPRVPVPDSCDIRAFASRVTGVHHWVQSLSFSNTAGYGAASSMPATTNEKRWER